MDQREIVFDENELGDLGSLAARLFQDTRDPRSMEYKRILVRPTIPWGKIAQHLLMCAAFCFGAVLGLRALGANGWQCFTGMVSVLALLGAVYARAIVLTAVRIYQRYAPDSLRNKCRYEPSCSQYMVLAVNKYGVIRGVGKGIRRLQRCNIDHGGFDEP